MNASQLFSGRAYSFNLEKEVKKNQPSYRFVEEILLKSNLEIHVDSISEIDSNENFDVYKVKSGEDIYTVKLSLDTECEHLKNEINFYKENDQLLIFPVLFDHGKIRIGSDLIYLICSYEDGYDIREDGILSVLDNWESFSYTLYHFSNLNTSNSFSYYIDLYTRDAKVKEGSEILKQSISESYELNSIQETFDLLKEEATTSSKSSVLKEESCCHGNLNLNNIVTMHGLYKLKNLNFCFKGSKFFDIAFFCVNSGITNSNSLLLFKYFCDFNEIDSFSNKKEFDECMKICSCLFFSKILFDYLIEESIFETRRPEKLLELSVNFSKSFHNLKRIKCKDIVSDTLKQIITRPILES